MKKWRIFFVAMLALLCVVTLENRASAEDIKGLTDSAAQNKDSFISSDGQFVYRYDTMSKGVTIQGYIGTAENVTVPEKIDGKNVENMQVVFYDNPYVRNVTVSANIKEMWHCFQNCPKLESVSLPERIGSVDAAGEVEARYMFMDCPKLTKVDFRKSSGIGEMKFSFEDGVIYCQNGANYSLVLYLESNTDSKYTVKKASCIL